MSDTEFKLVTRQETFNDLAVRELAKGRAACICRLQFGRCTRSECSSCTIGKQYSRCYSQMSDYDKQRLASYVSDRYVEYSSRPESWMNHRRYVRYILSLILYYLFIPVTILLICLVCLTSNPGDSPISQETDEQIEYIMRRVKFGVHDINDDGLVNCIDHAVLFKIYWDDKFPDKADQCIIIRNKKPAPHKMHHLFIGIKTDSILIEVEPRAHNIHKYLMKENWSSKYYNRNYNIYHETKKWLKEYKIE